MLICALSIIFSDNNDFRIFMVILLVMIGVIILIYKMFWNGLDKGTFNHIYSQNNLVKRDIVIRYCSIFALYAEICTVALFMVENTIGIIIAIAVPVLLLTVETILFFKHNQSKNSN